MWYSEYLEFLHFIIITHSHTIKPNSVVHEIYIQFERKLNNNFIINCIVATNGIIWTLQTRRRLPVRI